MPAGCTGIREGLISFSDEIDDLAMILCTLSM